MAAKKPAVPKGGPANIFGVNPRDLTLEQRRELFATRKAASTKDWRVLQPGSTQELVPFNILALDHVMKWGGLKREGWVYQIHGDEGSSKSTLGYTVAREYQKATGEAVAYFDYEGTTSSEYLRAIGVDESMLHLEHPPSTEDGIMRTVDLISQGVRLFFFDSIPRMQPDVKDADVMSRKAFGNTVGSHARSMSAFWRILLPKIHRANGALWMVNQTRSRIEMSREAKSAAEGYDTITNLNYTLPGGRDTRFAIGNMGELKQEKAFRAGKCAEGEEWLFDSDAHNGEQYLVTKGRIRSLKNKATGQGFREGTIWTRPGFGIDENISIRELARTFDLITNKGKRWVVGESFDDPIKVFDDKTKAIQALVKDQDPELLDALKKLVIAKIQSDDGRFQFTMSEAEQRYLAGEQDEFKASDSDLDMSKITLSDDEL